MFDQIHPSIKSQKRSVAHCMYCFCFERHLWLIGDMEINFGLNARCCDVSAGGVSSNSAVYVIYD